MTSMIEEEPDPLDMKGVGPISSISLDETIDDAMVARGKEVFDLNCKSALGSTRSSESFPQVTDKVRLADVSSEILNVPTMNGRFAQERTVTKNAAMSESRTFPPDAVQRNLTAR